ncbi:telomere length regulation TEL2 family protein [Aspergillus stella-maris]|uniref:telomere length regulation TEL2 family protein n=1 Tax=Aspergillus stella-maris TaxID=1810926 RepID=UPI003CCD122C
MDGLITELKTVRHNQEPALTAREEKISDVSSGIKESTPIAGSPADPSSPAQLLSILKSNPGQGEVCQVLAFLDPFRKDRSADSFDIRVPSPISAQLLNALVSITVQDHWEAINGNSSVSGSNKLRSALLRCLSNVPGISCLVTQLRSLISQSRASSQQADASGSEIRIRNVLEVISNLLEPTDLVWRLYADIGTVYSNATQKQVAWKELTSQLAAGRILSVSAEAISLAGGSDIPKKTSWIGTGSQYASWLGANICHAASKLSVGDKEQWKAVASLAGRALSLGYTDHLVREIYSSLLIEPALSEQFKALFDHLRWTEQLTLVEAVFRDVEKKYFSTESFSEDEMVLDQPISGVAALCSVIISKRAALENQLVEWLSKGQGGSIQTSALRRAIIANLAHQKGKPLHSSNHLLSTLLAKGLEQSADKIYMQHAPMRSQEANTQIILLAAGYLQRLDPSEMKSIGRSGVFLNTVSNRLAASSPRARFLGMIIGTAVSQLIEQPGKVMKFDLEEMESNEAARYLNLIHTRDEIGSLESIKTPSDTSSQPRQAPTKKSASAAAARGPGKPSHGTAKIVAIEEIEDSDEEDDDDDLIPYEKPDEDPSDEDEDPTLIHRNKPTAPVYIRELIIYLRDTENLDRHELAISTAPSLIRRKTGFGTELAEHTEELALVIVGLQEQSKFPKFHELRLQSMIALIVSQPLKMGRWFAAVFFDGDLSQAQRSAVLTALGLSARELAGVGADDAKAMGLPALPDSSFPSKKLPPALEAIYQNDEDQSPIASITRGIAQASLQPLAADAADSLSGPNALKVRTFSSRMEVEKRRQQREAHRQKSTVKDLYKVLAEGFFYPLTGRFEIMMMQFTSLTAPSHNPFFAPHLLTLFIQTLTLTLSTMGPHTPYLSTLTSQTLTFLLSLHARPLASEPTILAALLQLFLTTIDLNVEFGSTGEERLVNEFATQVIELREWVGEIFDGTPAVGDQSDPREMTRTLAAGVMVKLGEMMESYQGRLMGVGSGFKY